MAIKKFIRKSAKKVFKKVKTVTGNRYGRGFNQIINKGVPQMAKDIVMLKNMLNVEKKQVESTYSNYVGQVNANTTGALVLDITPTPSEGLTYTTRNGRSIKLTGATLHMSLIEMSAQNIRIKVKIMIVQVIGNPFSSNTTMLSELLDPNPLYGTIIDYQSDRNIQNFRQFRIIYNKNVTLYEDQGSTTGRQLVKKIHLKLKNHVKFDKDTTTVVDGQMYMVVLPESGNSSTATASTIANLPVTAINTGLLHNLYTRFYFIDN